MEEQYTKVSQVFPLFLQVQLHFASKGFRVAITKDGGERARKRKRKGTHKNLIPLFPYFNNSCRVPIVYFQCETFHFLLCQAVVAELSFKNNKKLCGPVRHSLFFQFIKNNKKLWHIVRRQRASPSLAPHSIVYD